MQTSVPVEQSLLAVLRQVLGPAHQPVPLHEPDFSSLESQWVQECLHSTFVSSVGRHVNQFEGLLQEFTGARYAVAVVNGTAALQVALSLAGVQPGDEVLVPSMSFVATANAVAHCGAIPHFVDVSHTTLGMDPVAMADYLKHIGQTTARGLINLITKRRISAIVPMHTFGHPVAMDALLALAGQYELPVIEDAAESLGSRIHGRHTGTMGLLGVLSFNGNKVITTGGGGAILTNDIALATRAKHLTTTAKRPHAWEFCHDEVAWNYRMPNLNAALGCAQMERLPSLLEAKRRLADRYRDAFSTSDHFRFIEEHPQTRSNYWLNTLQLATSDLATRNKLLSVVHEAGYQCRPVWNLLHRLPMFQTCPKAPTPVSEELEHSLICLPSSARFGAQTPLENPDSL